MPEITRDLDKRVLVVDDSCSTGSQMSAAVKIARDYFEGAVVASAVVYRHIDGGYEPRFWGADISGHVFFEWTWPNSREMESAIIDFDGVLCSNLDPEKCDDGISERSAMAWAQPLFTPRRTSIPMIATARSEKHRDQTTAWLTQHGIRYDKLVMRDWDIGPRETYEERIARWKAGLYRESHNTLFVESEEFQAKIIAEVAEKPVLCVGARRMF